MKKLFLVVFAFQFSALCFSQSATTQHYTDEEVGKLTSYISELEKRIAASGSADAHASDKKHVDFLLKNASHNYSNADIIKIFKYIKDLEKKESENDLAASTAAASLKKDPVAVTESGILPVEELEINFYQRVIFFNRRTDTLKEESYKPLDEVCYILIKYPDLHFEIEGHTDSVDTEAYNQDLSEKRALRVKKYFISKGIPSDRVTSIGYGESRPIDTNETPEGKARNRRVEIKIEK